jgi:hypothetical protein
MLARARLGGEARTHTATVTPRRGAVIYLPDFPRVPGDPGTGQAILEQWACVPDTHTPVKTRRKSVGCSRANRSIGISIG